MSDGHSDATRNSRFYAASAEAKNKRIQHKLEKTCLVLKDGTTVSLDGVQLLNSEKYDGSSQRSVDMLLLENGSRMTNLREVVRELIRKGFV